ncbi:hypothetical protein [Streptomyces griseorubiginosus]|uniref:hypothetical protein n=1 Tax=Streptomyces griseorubiginosus TaxID=67304 RepID=UPI0036E52759
MNLPAEHGVRLRTTHPVDSTFAALRLRTKATEGAGSAASATAMVFKPVDSAKVRSRSVSAPRLSEESAEAVAA